MSAKVKILNQIYYTLINKYYKYYKLIITYIFIYIYLYYVN